MKLDRPLTSVPIRSGHRHHDRLGALGAGPVWPSWPACSRVFARQPELIPVLQVRMFITAGLIDAPFIISAAVGLLLFASPFLSALQAYIG